MDAHTDTRSNPSAVGETGAAGAPQIGKAGCCSPRFRSDRIQPTTYNPLLPQPRNRSIASMSDAELRALWPTIPPADLRRHAPWATSRDVVRRVGYPAQPTASHADLEAYVRSAVNASRASPFVRPEELHTPPSPPGPGAFRLLPRAQVPVLTTAAGAVVTPPPVPVAVTSQSIRRQLDWIELALGETITARNLEPVIAANAMTTDRWVNRELKRVLAIDPYADPATAMQLRQWVRLNVGLIESGVKANLGPWQRRSLLNGVAEVVETAHRQGVRVEVLANDLVERFNVSNSRAQLIARDQVLSLNAQIVRSKQRNAGVTQYVWTTSRDERVRPEHQDLDGTTQSWDVPTSEGFPGDAVMCRCSARAVIPELEG
jgi:SPP1 gp7 family putative phage head morphogenesis protein